MAPPKRSLPLTEQHRLQELEQVIASGLQTFVEVGNALLTIRDERLYRATHTSFDAYCRERWGFSRIHAHRLIDGYEVVAALPAGNVPAFERQARELVPLKEHPEAMARAYLQAIEDTHGRPTAVAVASAVASEMDRLAATAIDPGPSDAAYAESEDEFAERSSHERAVRPAEGFKEVILLFKQRDWEWFKGVCHRAKAERDLTNTDLVLEALRCWAETTS